MTIPARFAAFRIHRDDAGHRSGAVILHQLGLTGDHGLDVHENRGSQRGRPRTKPSVRFVRGTVGSGCVVDRTRPIGSRAL